MNIKFIFMMPVYYWRYRRQRSLSRGEQPKPSSIDEQLNAFLVECLIFPLSVDVCGNPCGCVILRTPGEQVWGIITSDQKVGYVQ